MAKGLVTWSTTAATNAASDSTINFAEGQSPSSVNDSARALMASAAMWRDDTNGSLTTGGSSTAYTVTSNQSFASLTAMGNAVIAFVPHTTSGDAPTLAVDGLAAKKLRFVTGQDLPAGALIEGTPYVFTYFASVGEFLAHGLGSFDFYVPVAGGFDYWGSTAPNSALAFPYGQAISRTIYATAFDRMGTTFGTGDGSTTFNLPDKRGRVSVGKDDMGGSAASRVTTGGSSIDGTTLGAAGGAQTVTLARSDLPNAVPTFTGQGATHSLSVSNLLAGGAVTGTAAGGVGQGGIAIGQSHVNPTVTITPLGAVESLNGGVAQTTVNKMPPGIVCNYLIRVL